jgi:hypothetical protein
MGRKMSQQFDHGRLAAAAAAYTARQEAMRKPVHPYTLEASQLDLAAAIRKISMQAGERTDMVDRLARAAPAALIASLQLEELARQHGITQEDAEAISDAALLLGVPLSECDPRDPDIRLYRLFRRMLVRHERMVRQKDLRARRMILDRMRRWLVATPANHQRRERLLSPFAFWLLKELFPDPKPAHRLPHEEDPALARAIRIACEFVQLAEAGAISDTDPYETVQAAFRITNPQLRAWLKRHVPPSRFKSPEERLLFELPPDPLACLLEAAPAAWAAKKK